jgi:phosphatidylserine/phosphatidylglycerophosphate/cardiolipin synthase-like enzyme
MNLLESIQPVLHKNSAQLLKPGILSIRPGYKLMNGWPTKEKAIIAIKAQSAGAVSLPASVDGVPVAVRTATSIEEMRYRHPEQFAILATYKPELRAEAFDEVVAFPARNLRAAVDLALLAKPQIPYTPAAVPLSPVSGALTFTCHASPDSGWPTLRDFLQRVNSTLTVGLYDFTSKHILNEVAKDMAGGKTMELTLDNPTLNPTADQSDSDTIQALTQDLAGNFASAWALVRSNKDIQKWIYPTAYHIKVAVRDSVAVWVSSGNWNDSNQPDFDPISNPGPDDQTEARNSDRDWHVIVEDANLANTFEKYIQHDFSVATAQAGGGSTRMFFGAGPMVPANFAQPAQGNFVFRAPLRLVNEQATITPLLTPDPGVYQPAMLNLLLSATTKLYVQLQYIHPPKTGSDQELQDLIDVLAAKINGNTVDVRIIVSQYQTSNGWLDRLQAAGIDLRTVKIQNGVHNKGFVVDSATVALGSQNWSGDGVLRNRDASVIIENGKAAAYYEAIFLDDWNNIAKQSV